MNRLTTTLAALLFAAPAFGAQAPDTPFVTGPNFQQLPANKVYVTPTGGTQQTLSNALAAGCTVNCTFTTPTITGGTITGADGSGVNVTATGGTIGRSLASRFTDVINIKDFGAVCSGSGTDSSAVQNAINAGAGKARVLIPDTGAACMVNALQVPSHSHITVDGEIQLSNNVNGSLFTIANGATDVTIDGHGIIDGNRANNTVSGTGGINSSLASDIVIRDVTIQNFRSWPFNIVGTTGCLVDNVTATNSGNAPEFARGTNNCWASHLKISGISDESFSFYWGPVWNSGITDSVITGGGVSGVSVYNDDGTQPVSHDLLISNNIISGMQQSCIDTIIGGPGVPAATNHYKITITGNHCYGNGQGGVATGDLGLHAVSDSMITNNFLASVGDGSTGAIDIKIDGSSGGLTVAGNTILNPAPGTTLGQCFLFNTTGTIFDISGNHCISDTSPSSIAFVFSGGLPVSTRIDANQAVNLNGFYSNMTSLANGSIFYTTDPCGGSYQVVCLDLAGSIGTKTAIQMNGSSGALTIGSGNGSFLSTAVFGTNSSSLKNTGGGITVAGSPTTVTMVGHSVYTGTAPTPSACGTTPSISSAATDTKGTVTEGTTATGCVVTFAVAYTTAPDCVVSSPNGAGVTSYSTSTSALTIVNASASGNKYTYMCIQ